MAEEPGVPEQDAEQVIDWSLFSMARYLHTADRADDRVLRGSTWDGFVERLAEAGRLVLSCELPDAAVDRASAFRGLWVTPAQRRSILDERLRQ